MSKKNYISKEGYEKLIQELHDMKTHKLPEVIDRISEARSQGDLSENFDYKSALEDRDLVEARIVEIESLLKNVEIADEKSKSTKGSKIVSHGSIVRLKLEDDKEYKVTIVGSAEIQAEDNALHISLDSPLGLAIADKKAGEEGIMKLPTGKQVVKILSVN